MARKTTVESVAEMLVRIQGRHKGVVIVEVWGEGFVIRLLDEEEKAVEVDNESALARKLTEIFVKGVSVFG